MSPQSRLCHVLVASIGTETDARALADLVWLAFTLRSAVVEGAACGTATSVSPTVSIDVDEHNLESNVDPQHEQPPSIASATVDADSQVRLFPSSPTAARLSTMLPATIVRVPAGEALPQRRLIERSLKPFKQRLLSRRQKELDPVATANASAERRVISPIYRASQERWFEITLLVESSHGMQVWAETVIDLQRLLDRHGAFRRVRVWRYTVHAGNVALSSANGSATTTRSIIDTQGRSVCLLLTNGTSEEWVRQPLLRFVEQLGLRSPTAILQMLPRRAWPHTVLGDSNDYVLNGHPGTATRRLYVRDPFTAAIERASDCRTVPVLTLEPHRLENWAQFVMAKRLMLHPAVRLEVHEQVVSATVSEDGVQKYELTPSARLAAFRAIASPQAYQLLRLLAGVPLTLPIMRLIQVAMAGERAQVHLAEVMLSGLVDRLSEINSTDSAESSMFEFCTGIREELLDSLSVCESLQIDDALQPVQERVRQFVESQTGRAVKDFGALLADTEGMEQLDDSVRSFLSVSRRIYDKRYLLTELTMSRMEAVPSAISRPYGFLSEDEIRLEASRGAVTQSPSSRLRTLLIFSSAQQHTWLVASHDSLMILLDDKETRASGRLMQRQTDWLDALPIAVNKNPHPIIHFGPKERPAWYYSEALFPTQGSLMERVFALVPGGPRGPISQLRELSVRYEETRRSVKPGRSRTQTMVLLVQSMRALLPCDAFNVSLAVKSKSAGNRLVAVLALQDRLDAAYLDWLLDRLLDDHAFTALNVARALYDGMKSLDEDDRKRLRLGVESARRTLQSRGLLDKNVHDTLGRILSGSEGNSES